MTRFAAFFCLLPVFIIKILFQYNLVHSTLCSCPNCLNQAIQCIQYVVECVLVSATRMKLYSQCSFRLFGDFSILLVSLYFEALLLYRISILSNTSSAISCRCHSLYSSFSRSYSLVNDLSLSVKLMCFATKSIFLKQTKFVRSQSKSIIYLPFTVYRFILCSNLSHESSDKCVRTQKLCVRLSLDLIHLLDSNVFHSKCTSQKFDRINTK